MIFTEPLPQPDPLRARLRAHYRADETGVAQTLLAQAELTADLQDRIAQRARQLVRKVRENRVGQGGIDAFMHAYELSSKEGVVLMCLAEALLRIPDPETANMLIRDKLRDADFGSHLGESDSIFVNASTWALMLTGRIMQMEPTGSDLKGVLKRLVTRSGEPVIRQAVMQAMRILGRQFVMGRTIEEALERARPAEEKGYRHSYDMLGEAARTAPDAERYLTKAGLWDRITYHMADGLEVLSTANGTFDVVYVDTHKFQYPEAWRQARTRIRVGGLYLCDNVLWDGRVAGLRPFDAPGRDAVTEAIASMSRAVASDERARIRSAFADLPASDRELLEQALAQPGTLMGRGIARQPFADQAMLAVDRDVVLVAKRWNGDVDGWDGPILARLCLGELHRPARIAVLLPQLGGLVLPGIGNAIAGRVMMEGVGSEDFSVRKAVMVLALDLY